jgi:molecular chaperone Hsp33
LRDTLTRFVLDSAPVRGGVVHLDRAYLDAIENHDYPLLVRDALGEMLAGVALLGSSLKWEGALVLQIQSQGPLRLLCAEVSHALDVRAVASIEGALVDSRAIGENLKDARAVLTLDPKAIDENAQIYQGIVAVDEAGIAPTLEGYMLQSQQVRTCLILAANATGAAGIFVQKLPGEDAASAEAFARVEALTRTLTADELLTLDAQTLLHRLFHEEVVRVLPSQMVRFFCPCSRERVAGALRLLGRAEAESIIAERGEIEAKCQFCNRAFRFGRADVQALFDEHPDVQGSQTRH